MRHFLQERTMLNKIKEETIESKIPEKASILFIPISILMQSLYSLKNFLPVGFAQLFLIKLYLSLQVTV